jgi:phospholipid-translocating ATPase
MSNGSRLNFDTLDIFPFSSESKCIGIVMRDTQSGDITFLQKGADVVMMKIVLRLAGRRDSVNMAREGLRTLIMARKRLGYTTYSDLANIYHAASIRLEGRNEAMSVVVAQF